MFEEDKRFDEMFRSVLSDASEDVPVSVWNSVQERLDHAGTVRKRVIFLRWIRSSAIAAGMAAAIAVAVIFFGTSHDYMSPGRNEIAVIRTDYDAAHDLTAKVFELTDPEPVPEDFRRHSAGEPMVKAENSGNGPEQETVGTEEHVSVNIGKHEDARNDAKGHESEKNASDTGVEEYGVDDFLSEEDNERERKARASFVVFGNAVSNGTSKNGVSREINPPSLNSPSPASPTQNTVSETGESTYGIPLSFGLGAKILLTDRWSLAAGFNYTHLSRSFAGNYIQINEKGEIDTKVFSSISNVQDYVGIPVNAYYSILKNNIIDFYTYFGGSAEKCVSNRYIMKAEPENFIHREKVKGLQFSVNAGIGMEFIIANQIGLYIDPNIRYYFNNGQPKSIRTTYKNNILLGFEAGLRVRL